MVRKENEGHLREVACEKNSVMTQNPSLTLDSSDW